MYVVTINMLVSIEKMVVLVSNHCVSGDQNTQSSESESSHLVSMKLL